MHNRLNTDREYDIFLTNPIQVCFESVLSLKSGGVLVLRCLFSSPGLWTTAYPYIAEYSSAIIGLSRRQALCKGLRGILRQ